jgi:hypothetical protein
MFDRPFFESILDAQVTEVARASTDSLSRPCASEGTSIAVPRTRRAVRLGIALAASLRWVIGFVGISDRSRSPESAFSITGISNHDESVHRQ